MRQQVTKTQVAPLVNDNTSQLRYAAGRITLLTHKEGTLMTAMRRIAAAKAAFNRVEVRMRQACAASAWTSQANDALNLSQVSSLLAAGSVTSWLPTQAQEELAYALGHHDLQQALHIIDSRACGPLPVAGQALRRSLLQLRLRMKQPDHQWLQRQSVVPQATQTSLPPTLPQTLPQTLIGHQRLLGQLKDPQAQRIVYQHSQALQLDRSAMHEALGEPQAAIEQCHPVDIVALDCTWWQAQWSAWQFEQRRSLSSGSSSGLAPRAAQIAQIVRHCREKHYRSALQLAAPLIDVADNASDLRQASLLGTRAAWLAGQPMRAMSLLYALPSDTREASWHRWAMAVALHYRDEEALDECLHYLVENHQADAITHLHAAQAALRHGNAAVAEIHLRIVADHHNRVLRRLAQQRLTQLFLAQERLDEARYAAEHLLALTAENAQAQRRAMALMAAIETKRSPRMKIQRQIGRGTAEGITQARQGLTPSNESIGTWDLNDHAA